MKDITKNYSNGEVTIKWQPNKCIHSAVCLRELPQVYNPNERPWLKIENATTEELKKQVSKCPSGALSYFMNDSEDKTAESLETKIEVLENGPLLVYGTLKITGKDGNLTLKDKTTAFCRCGYSSNKPYCDGSHIKSEFIG